MGDRSQEMANRSVAGLWDSWDDSTTGKPLETFTIFTTDPNEVMEPIHDLMPVVPPWADYARWLALGDAAQPPADLL